MEKERNAGGHETSWPEAGGEFRPFLAQVNMTRNKKTRFESDTSSCSYFEDFPVSRTSPSVRQAPSVLEAGEVPPR
jgi:hypothetical protein